MIISISLPFFGAEYTFLSLYYMYSLIGVAADRLATFQVKYSSFSSYVTCFHIYNLDK